MMRKLLLYALLAATLPSAHAKPLAAAPSALGGWIILEDRNCESPVRSLAPLQRDACGWAGCFKRCHYLSSDKQKVVAREGSTLTPIVWPADEFHVIPPEYQRQLEGPSAP